MWRIDGSYSHTAAAKEVTSAIPVATENSPEANGRLGLFTCTQFNHPKISSLLTLVERMQLRARVVTISTFPNSSYLVDIDVVELIQTHNVHIHAQRWNDGLATKRTTINCCCNASYKDKSCTDEGSQRKYLKKSDDELEIKITGRFNGQKRHWSDTQSLSGTRLEHRWMQLKT